MKKSITYNGLMLGAVFALQMAIFYLISLKLLFHPGLSMLIGVAFPIFFMRRGLLEERAANEGMMSFGEAMSVAFPIFVIGMTIQTLVTVLIYLTDPNFTQVAMEVAQEAVEKTMNLIGNFADINEEEKAKALEEMKANQPTIGISTLFLGFLGNLVFPGAILALILSAIFKKT